MTERVIEVRGKRFEFREIIMPILQSLVTYKFKFCDIPCRKNWISWIGPGFLVREKFLTYSNQKIQIWPKPFSHQNGLLSPVLWSTGGNFGLAYDRGVSLYIQIEAKLESDIAILRKKTLWVPLASIEAEKKSMNMKWAESLKADFRGLWKKQHSEKIVSLEAFLSSRYFILKVQWSIIRLITPN